MIPKIIHYCWFSDDKNKKKPRTVRKCLKSWEKKLKGYEIRVWDNDSFDFDSVPFVKDAFQRKKWAFVADYVRMYALYTEGGIYLDTDVAVLKDFDEYLTNNFFAGTDCRNLQSSQYGVEAAIMGAEKGHPLIKEFMEYYESLDSFMDDNGNMKCKIIPDVLIPILAKYGYKPEDKTQILKEGVVIYSTDHFANSESYDESKKDLIRARHFNTASWVDHFDHRGRLYNFCRDHDLLHIFEPIEQVIHTILFWKKF